MVGGGLAGTFFAAESLRAGHHVQLVDDAAPGGASRIAAGLYNIITGRKAAKTWQAEALLATLADFLQVPEMAPLRQAVHPMTIYRPHRTAGEYNDWMARAADPAYTPHVRHIAAARLPDVIENPLGGLEILPCGWVDTGLLLDKLQQVLTDYYGLVQHRQRLDYAAIDPGTGKVLLAGQNQIFDEIVFAEGAGIRHNPWFGALDIRPLKGQIVDIEMEGFDPDYVLLRKVFMIPKGKNIYTVGSTYEKYFQDTEPSAAGVEELSGRIKAAVRLPFKVVDTRAGIRPTTPNRRPLIATHPNHSRLHVLNGMGTKGVLQAPWAARLLRQHLDGAGTELPREVGIERFLQKIS